MLNGRKNDFFYSFKFSLKILLFFFYILITVPNSYFVPISDVFVFLFLLSYVSNLSRNAVVRIGTFKTVGVKPPGPKIRSVRSKRGFTGLDVQFSPLLWSSCKLQQYFWQITTRSFRSVLFNVGVTVRDFATRDVFRFRVGMTNR